MPKSQQSWVQFHSILYETVESEGRQMTQFWIKYLKIQAKIYLYLKNPACPHLLSEEGELASLEAWINQRVIDQQTQQGAPMCSVFDSINGARVK